MKECFDTTSSTDFCKKVTSDEERSAYFGRDWESAREYNAEEIFNHFLKGSTDLRLTGSNVVGDKVDYRVQINYNPEAKFQYFTSESSVHDGTLLFQLEAMYKCVQRVVTGSTSLPQWACIVNYIPLAMILFPLHVGGAGNWSGTAMFIGLLLLI